MEEGAFGEISLRDHLPFPLRSPFLKRKPIAESAATASATDGAKVPSARPCRPHYNISDIPRAGGGKPLKISKGGRRDRNIWVA